jgi:2-dehydro-3-deoxygluconokinase
VPDLVCLGEAMIEFNRQPPAADGRTYWLEGHGGDTSNCAIAATRQGASAGYVTAVGRDPFGDSLMQLWAREMVDTSAVILRADAPTGLYFVTHSEHGHEFTYRRAGSAASLLTADEVPERYIGAAKIFHTSAISQAISASAGAAVLHAMALARKHAVTVAYDTNLRLRLWPIARARPAVEDACRRADVVFTSDEEAEALWGEREADAVADKLLAMGPSVVIVKRGAHGALAATPQSRHQIAGHAVRAVDATGAGDAFAGTFLARRLLADDVLSAARYANAAAALKTTGYGAVAPLPRPEAVRALLRGG